MPGGGFPGAWRHATDHGGRAFVVEARPVATAPRDRSGEPAPGSPGAARRPIRAVRRAWGGVRRSDRARGVQGSPRRGRMGSLAHREAPGGPAVTACIAGPSLARQRVTAPMPARIDACATACVVTAGGAVERSRMAGVSDASGRGSRARTSWARRVAAVSIRRMLRMCRPSKRVR